MFSCRIVTPQNEEGEEEEEKAPRPEEQKTKESKKKRQQRLDESENLTVQILYFLFGAEIFSPLVSHGV